MICKSLGFLIDVTLYNQQIYVAVNQTREQLAGRLPQLMSEKQTRKTLTHIFGKNRKEPLPGMVCRSKTTRGIFMWLRDMPLDIEAKAVLGHESFHCVEEIMKRVGIPYHEKYSSEAWAYLQGFIELWVNYYVHEYVLRQINAAHP